MYQNWLSSLIFVQITHFLHFFKMYEQLSKFYAQIIRASIKSCNLTSETSVNLNTTFTVGYN